LGLGKLNDELHKNEWIDGLKDGWMDGQMG
jgi:hypothetical protein